MTTEYDILRTRIKFGDRAFSVAGPRELNALPVYVNNNTDLSVILQISHKVTFWYWLIRIEQFYFSRLYYVRRFWEIWGGGCKIRHMNGFYLLDCCSFTNEQQRFFKFCPGAHPNHAHALLISSRIYFCLGLSVRPRLRASRPPPDHDPHPTRPFLLIYLHFYAYPCILEYLTSLHSSRLHSFPLSHVSPFILPLVGAKVKYKYDNRKPMHDFLYDGNSNVCPIYHNLRGNAKYLTWKMKVN